MIRKTAAAALVLLCFAPAARAQDAVSFEAGHGNEDTNLARVGVQANWPRRWRTQRAWTGSAYWDLQLGRWYAPLGDAQPRQEIWDISLTPVFRLERAERTALVPYVEAGIGFHLLSEKQVNSQRRLGTHFQYGDHVGAGVRFGPGWRYDASLRFQHLSNGGLARPNPGINFLQLRVAVHF
jgi:lipid A 3-O-deacylase